MQNLYGVSMKGGDIASLPPPPQKGGDIALLPPSFVKGGASQAFRPPPSLRLYLNLKKENTDIRTNWL